MNSYKFSHLFNELDSLLGVLHKKLEIKNMSTYQIPLDIKVMNILGSEYWGSDDE